MKVFFDTVGCRLNQAEIEHLAGQFRAAGHEVVDSPRDADLVVVNTCAVTAAAASDSRQKTRQAEQAGARRIVLTGCWATLEPQKAEMLPGVSDVVSNLEKMDIPLRILGSVKEDFEIEPLLRQPLPGAHRRTRAFIKAQDGCDNFCTFCVTRLARGRGSSVPKEAVLKDVLAAEEGGVHEVVLSGVHLASWGKDAAANESITDLIKFLLQNSSVERIRLSSIEPWDLDEAFFELWQNPRMCRHLHLPLQSGSAGVLKRMARNTSPDAFAGLVEMARAIIPGAAITTDVIVGFPGESDDEFKESLSFVRRIGFSGGHVFRYSPREGTAATRLPGRVDGRIAKERAARMHEVIRESESAFLSSAVGKEVSVLWEGNGKQDKTGWTLYGLTDQYMKVEARAMQNRWNQIDRVFIEDIKTDTLRGRIE